MTSAARMVLQDARHALRCHTDDLRCEAFRVSWFSVIGLLRAVGHALDKVDGYSSPAMRLAVDAKWRELQASRPEPIIFWSFIEEERNRFLKNYEHGVARLLVSRAPSGEVRTISDAGTAQGAVLTSAEEVWSLFKEGPFAGRRELEVAWQAHDWWEKYLAEVDALAAAESAA